MGQPGRKRNDRLDKPLSLKSKNIHRQEDKPEIIKGLNLLPIYSLIVCNNRRKQKADCNITQSESIIPHNILQTLIYLMRSSTTLHAGSVSFIVFPFTSYASNAASFTFSGSSNVLCACISLFVTIVDSITS